MSEGRDIPEPRGFGRWAVRLLAIAGCLLLVLGTVGWWLSSRVIDRDGFSGVVAEASQQEAVRDYAADQATLRLARTSNFVSAARPLVTEAISQAIATPPVEDAVRAFASRAHEQVFRAHTGDRVDVDASQASTTIRSALQAINPGLAKKLPADVLDVSTTISQSSEVDLLFGISSVVDGLAIPVMLLGVGLLVLACAKARDRVHAVRTVGILLAVAGALLLGFGASSPVLAVFTGTDDPARAGAVSAFIGVLVGRLLGVGQAMALIGLLLVFAPGRDGGDLRARADRMRAWFDRKRASRRWRVAGALAIVAVGAMLLTMPEGLYSAVLKVGAIAVMYVGVVFVLRATGRLTPGQTTAPIRKRRLVGVAAVMVLAFVGTAGVAVAVVNRTVTTPTADPGFNGCNGYVELCLQPLDQVVWAASHNAMNSAAYNFFAAEHTITIPEQLNAGARFFMLDAYYGYDDNGIVRTNLAGGVDRKQLEKERGKEAVRELDRLGALTGTADTSGTKDDVYFCHDFCELGAVRAQQVLHDIRVFLERNLTDVVALDVEDYVTPAALRDELEAAGLLDRVFIPEPGATEFPTLGEITAPKAGEYEQKRRLIVMTEKAKSRYPWQLRTYDVFEETPYDFQEIDQFNCQPNRGRTGNPLLLVNHWLRPDGPPDPAKAARVNSKATLTRRLQQCIVDRNRIPNVLAVDFTAIGDLYETVDRFNAAIAKVTGVTEYETALLARSDEFSDEEKREIAGFHRLPKISEAKALELLGPGAALLVPPPAVVAAESPSR